MSAHEIRWFLCKKQKVACFEPLSADVCCAQAFQDLVDTNEAASGKLEPPLGNAENVAMLQVSGTLANR